LIGPFSWQQENTMKTQPILVPGLLLGAMAAALFCLPSGISAGPPPLDHKYQVLDPIRQGNLTIFPVVAATSHDTSEFLTLDEGLRSGAVEVTETGRAGRMVRGPERRQYRGDEVNKLYLVNDSKRPLLLLAGEVVTGGKQDRIVGKDLIIPAGEESDLDVFCVEHGRWTETSAKFGSAGAYGGVGAGVGGGGYMAQPSIRAEAQGKKDQVGVWNQVSRAKESMADSFSVAGASGPATAAPVATELAQVSSYARVMENHAVAAQVDKVAAPIEHSYESAIHHLSNARALGVVVAVDGRIVWADVFASTELLEKYWPKLARSYAAQAVETDGSREKVSMQAAQDFLDQIEGQHQESDSDPGVYRYTEVSGNGYKVFELTSLMPRTGFEVHWAKMAD
jgi:hypothetical protein